MKILCFNHYEPIYLYLLEADVEEREFLESHDYYCENVDNCDGLYLVGYNDEFLDVFKVEGESVDEVKKNLKEELIEFFKDYNETECELLPKTLGHGYYMYIEDINEYKENGEVNVDKIADVIFDRIDRSEVDSDSDERFGFMMFDKNEEADSFDEVFDETFIFEN